MDDLKMFHCSQLNGVTLQQVSAWPGARDRLEKRIAHFAAAGHRVLHIAPDRYWIIGADALTQADESADYASVDLSQAFVVFRLEGAAVRKVLRKGLAIDLHPRVFNDGSVATSMLEGITVTVIRCGDSFELYCQRSYADSIRQWLLDAAQEFIVSR